MGLIKDALFSDAGLCEFSAIQWRTPPPSQCEPLCMEYIYVSKKPFAGLKTAVRDTRQFNTHTPRSEILDIPLQIISPFRNK